MIIDLGVLNDGGFDTIGGKKKPRYIGFFSVLDFLYESSKVFVANLPLLLRVLRNLKIIIGLC